MTPRLEQLEYIEAVLDVAWRADNNDLVFWRPWPEPDGPWRAMALCSDWFIWGCADCEEVLPEDLPLLRRCLEDLQAVEAEAGTEGNKNDQVATCYVGELFASRKRQLRPMRCVYTDTDSVGPLVAALLDAAGPPRTDPEGKR